MNSDAPPYPSRSTKILAHEDFNSFITDFSQSSHGKTQWYRSDIIFHELLPRPASGERRFRGGLILWTFWILLRFAIPKVFSLLRIRPVGKSRPSKYAFRFLTTPAHQDTLLPILRDETPPEERTLYGTDLEADPGHEVVFLCDLRDNLAISSGRELWTALRTALRFAKDTSSLVSGLPVLEGVNLPEELQPRLAETRLKEELKYLLLSRQACTHELMFLTFEIVPETKAWVRWGLASNARIIHVMHGQRLPIYQISLATDTVLFSKLDEPWFRERLPKDARIWTNGHPRLEAIRKSIAPLRPASSRRRPRIAFFSQPCENDHTPAVRALDFKILAGLNDIVELRIRPHPREDQQTLIRQLGECGCRGFELSGGSLMDDLAWCDAVASSWSTVAMEGAVAGREVFWCCASPEKYPPSRELQQAGIGVLVSGPNGWLAHLDDWYSDCWSGRIALLEQRVRSLGFLAEDERPFLQRLAITPHSEA